MSLSWGADSFKPSILTLAKGLHALVISIWHGSYQAKVTAPTIAYRTTSTPFPISLPRHSAGHHTHISGHSTTSALAMVSQSRLTILLDGFGRSLRAAMVQPMSRQRHRMLHQGMIVGSMLHCRGRRIW